MKPFVLFLGFVALLVAGCAAFFSVKGIGLLFAGAAMETMIMASILELAKLVATSYLYRYWTKTSAFLRYYLLVAVLTLMMITSLGIFGFLSSAYQKSSSEFGVYTSKIQMIEQEKKYVTDQMDTSAKRIDSLNKNRNDSEQRMTDAQAQAGKSLLGSQVIKLQNQTANIIEGISKDITTENDHLKSLQSQAQAFDQQEVDLKAQSQTTKDIITFQFIADALGLPLNTVVKYFIFIIIIVFDPLAVGLVLAYNTAIYKVEEEDVKKKSDPTPIVDVPTTIVPPPLSSLPNTTEEEDDKQLREHLSEMDKVEEEPVETTVIETHVEEPPQIEVEIPVIQPALPVEEKPTTFRAVKKDEENPHIEVLQKAYQKYKNEESGSIAIEDPELERQREEYRRRSNMVEKLKDGTSSEPISPDDMDKIRKQ